jgi:hypothetical protein
VFNLGGDLDSEAVLGAFVGGAPAIATVSPGIVIVMVLPENEPVFVPKLGRPFRAEDVQQDIAITVLAAALPFIRRWVRYVGRVFAQPIVAIRARCHVILLGGLRRSPQNVATWVPREWMVWPEYPQDFIRHHYPNSSLPEEGGVHGRAGFADEIVPVT